MSSRPLLAAAIIVRDEADHLRRCLASVQGLCDEIVVVDTGSTDDTMDVARVHGAVLLERPWDGNFSAARNLGLDRATAEWILYIDADEEVQPHDPREVHAHLRAADGVVAFTVRFATRVGWTPYWEHRMWRHRPDIRFRNTIHETHVPDLRRINRTEGLRIERGPLAIQHYGYEGDQRHKHRRNLPLLQQQVLDTPRRVYLWNHMGNVLDGLGRADEAEVAWRRGVAIVREDGLKEVVDILPFGSLALHLLRNRRDAAAIIDEGLALNPDHYTLVLADARRCALEGRFEDAVTRLHRLIDVDDAGHHHMALAYDGRMFATWPQQLLGESLFELGRFAEAADAFAAAMERGGDPAELRAKIALCRSLAGPRPASGDEPLTQE